MTSLVSCVGFWFSDDCFPQPEIARQVTKMEHLRKADGTVQEEGNDKAEGSFCLNWKLLDVRLERQSISIINLCSLTIIREGLLIR